MAEMEVEREEVRKKTVSFPVSAIPGFGGWPRRARFGSSRSTCWSTPGCAHGDSDQSGEYSGSVEPIQPVGVMKDSRMSARYGLRGVRVGEAKNPGPRRRLRRVSSEGPIYHDLTLVDSSDDDTPFVLPWSVAGRGTATLSLMTEWARRDFSLSSSFRNAWFEAVRMEDSSGLPVDRVRRLRLFSGVDPVRPTVPDSDGSGTEAPTSVSDGFS